MITKETLVKDHGIEDKSFDYSLPQDWCYAVRDITGIYPAFDFVWLYDEKAPMFGRPYPLNIAGWVIMALLPDHMK